MVGNTCALPKCPRNVGIYFEICEKKFFVSRFPTDQLKMALTQKIFFYHLKEKNICFFLNQNVCFFSVLFINVLLYCKILNSNCIFKHFKEIQLILISFSYFRNSFSLFRNNKIFHRLTDHSIFDTVRYGETKKYF